MEKVASIFLQETLPLEKSTGLGGGTVQGTDQ